MQYFSSSDEFVPFSIPGEMYHVMFCDRMKVILKKDRIKKAE